MSKSELNESDVISKLNNILQAADLTTTTKKQIREQLKNEFDVDIKKWRKVISQHIEEYANKIQSSDSSDDELIIPKKTLKKRKLNNNTSKNTKTCDNDNDHYDNKRKISNKNGKKELFEKESDDKYFMTLPNGTSVEKRCVLSKYRGKLYIGFREYYEKNNQKLPSKKGINLTPQQWKFIVEHIDDIDAQYKLMT